MDAFLIFIPFKDKIDNVYVYLQAYFRIEYYGDLNKYRGIELDFRPYGSIHIRQTYLAQRIMHMITVMNKSSAKPNPEFKPLLETNVGAQPRIVSFNYRSVIRSLKLFIKSMIPEAQFAVRQYVQFSIQT